MIKTANDKSIAQAAQILRVGGIVAMPTETVYGLAGNALDGAAVARIYAAKGRPSFNPLIAHFASVEQVLRYVDLDEKEGRRAAVFKSLAQGFWPGPLTMILPRVAGCGISELATAGLNTIAVRIPDHPVARALIEACGFPLVAPSANKSGALSPTSPAHVADSLGDKVDMILAAGACRVGLESTVLDLSGASPTILRPGAITAEDISAVLGIEIFSAENLEPEGAGSAVSPHSAASSHSVASSHSAASSHSVAYPHSKLPVSSSCSPPSLSPELRYVKPKERGSVAVAGVDANANAGVQKEKAPAPLKRKGGEAVSAPKSPGMLLKHYAPDTPLRLNAIDLGPGEALLAFGSDKFMGIKGGGAAKDLPAETHRNLSEAGDLHEAAANLFAMLKALDQAEAKTIAVMSIPEMGIGLAINDRLKRAVAKDES